jgi:transcriptional regulator with XRE-family HTH domain
VNPETFRRKVASRVRLARWRLGLTQEEAAVQAGVTMRYLAEIERGHRNPTLGVLFDIARIMRVALADFVDVGDAPRVALDDLDLHPPPRGRKPKPRRRR